MKVTAILLTAFCLQVSARSGAQITYKASGKPLVEALQEVGKQYHYKFFYRADDVKKISVSLAVSNASIEEFLRACLQDKPFTFEVEGRSVFLARADPKEKAVVPLPPPPLAPLPADIVVRVVNQEGDAVGGATIQEKGGKIVGITNSDGVARVKVDSDATLVITAVNILTVERRLEGNRDLTVQVTGKTGKLDEVQVIAYGTTSQRFGTGNVASVKAADIAKQPVMNPLLTLQGRVPGLFVNQLNGLPGGGVQISIQGINSISNGNNPFYVIDGIPYSSEMLSTVGKTWGGFLGGGSERSGSGNPLSYINPSDIESIEVLKDADATAIYGSRAANGAILITTKKGKSGQTKIDFNLQQGFGGVASKLDVLETPDYLMMRREAKKNDNSTVATTDYDINGFWDTTRNTDWQKELIGKTASFTNLTSTISGGTKNLQYLLSGFYQRQTTVFPGNLDNVRGGIHFNMNAMTNNERLRVSFGGSYMDDRNKLPFSDLTGQALMLAPTAPPLYNADGTLNWAPTATGTSTWQNPLKETIKPYENRTNNLLANASFSYLLVKGLFIKANFGINRMETNEFSGSKTESVRPESRLNFARSANYALSKVNNWTAEPQLAYANQFGLLRVDAVAGATWQNVKGDGYTIVGNGYTSDALLRDVRSATTVRIDNSEQSLYRYSAFFSRVNLIYDNRYILNLSGRRDGSSRFGTDNKFHNFWSAGAGWIFTETDFFKDNVKFLKFGKVRASYGTTGNDQFANYSYLSLYNSIAFEVPYQASGSLYPVGHANPSLQWEVTKKAMIGLDLGFLDERFNLNLTYVDNRSENQLLNYFLPDYSGFNAVMRNFPALVQNREWQVALNMVNIKKKNFLWSTDFNITIPSNKLLAFPGIERSTYVSTLVVGEPVTILKRLKYLGVDPATGKYVVADSKGNPITNPIIEDRTELINTLPKYYGGLSNNITFKNLDLSFLLSFTSRISTNLNGGNAWPGYYGTNQPKFILERWRANGDVAPYQYFTSRGSNSTEYNNMKSSDVMFSDASFIRLRNVSLSYRLPAKILTPLNLDLVRFFVNGQNLLTVTSYKGLDPESSVNSLPPLRIVTFGIQVTL